MAARCKRNLQIASESGIEDRRIRPRRQPKPVPYTASAPIYLYSLTLPLHSHVLSHLRVVLVILLVLRQVDDRRRGGLHPVVLPL